MSKKTGSQGKGRSKPRQKGDPQVQADPSTESVGSQERTGRPPKYKSEFAAQAQKLCLLGATDKDLAEFFDAVANNDKKRIIASATTLNEILTQHYIE